VRSAAGFVAAVSRISRSSSRFSCCRPVTMPHAEYCGGTGFFASQPPFAYS
jgi:hypothetical protein